MVLDFPFFKDLCQYLAFNKAPDIDNDIFMSTAVRTFRQPFELVPNIWSTCDRCLVCEDLVTPVHLRRLNAKDGMLFN